MSVAQRSQPDEVEELAEMIAVYRRLAEMDPPALRSLAADFQRQSDESAASHLLQLPPQAHARARRDAQRAAAAWAALVSEQSEA